MLPRFTSFSFWFKPPYWNQEKTLINGSYSGLFKEDDKDLISETKINKLHFGLDAVAGNVNSQHK